MKSKHRILVKKTVNRHFTAAVNAVWLAAGIKE